MMMKRICPLLLFFAGVPVACMKTEPTVFEVSAASPLDALQGSLTLEVTCDYVWTASLSNSSFGSVSSEVTADGGTIVVNLGINTSGERNCVLSVRSGSQEIKRELSQKGIYSLFDSEEEVLLSGTAQRTYSFFSPVPWKIDITEGADWITPIGPASGEKGMVTVKVQAREPFVDVGERVGNMKFTFDGKSVFNLPVRQRQTNSILAGDATIGLDSFGEGDITLETAFNVDYEVSVDSPWIHHAQTKALHEAREHFHIDANESLDERRGKIIFTGEGVTTEVTLVQPGMDPILKVVIPGAYNVESQDYVYGAERFTQLSRMHDPENGFSQRLLNPWDAAVMELSGIPILSPEGERFVLKLALRLKGALSFSRFYDAHVAFSSDSLLWIKADEGDTYFVVKK